MRKEPCIVRCGGNPATPSILLLDHEVATVRVRCALKDGLTSFVVLSGREVARAGVILVVVVGGFILSSLLGHRHSDRHAVDAHRCQHILEDVGFVSHTGLCLDDLPQNLVSDVGVFVVAARFVVEWAAQPLGEYSLHRYGSEVSIIVVCVQPVDVEAVVVPVVPGVPVPVCRI